MNRTAASGPARQPARPAPPDGSPPPDRPAWPDRAFTSGGALPSDRSASPDRPSSPDRPASPDRFPASDGFSPPARPGLARRLPWPLLPPLALLGLWAWLGYGGVVPGYMLPKPHELLDTIGHYVFGETGGTGNAGGLGGFGVTNGLGHAGRFLPDLLASLARAGAGFAWAAALGLPLGVLSGRLPGPRRALSPLINAIRAVPGISWLPLALVWFGIGLTTTIFLIGLAAFFPIYLGTVAGVAGAPPVLERAGAMLGLSRIGVLARVVLPAGMGHVVTGLRLGLGASFAYLVLGELTGVPDGLGARIMDARMSGRVDVIMAGMLAIALTGFLADRLLVRVLGLLVPGARAPRPDRTASRPSGRRVSPNKPSSSTLALTRPAPDPRPEPLVAALDADPADSPDSRVHGAALSIRGLTVCHAADCPDRLHPSAPPPYADAPDPTGPERALAETGQDRPRPADQADPAVLRDLSLDADPGQIVAILGQSGCGKTTLLDAVAGFTRPLRGHIRLDGRESIGPSPQKAVVFQEDALFPWLSALDNAAFGLAARGLGRRERRRAARTMLDRLGLGGACDMPPSALSGGMRQRVALARALLLEPRLLLMDEPFAALDAFTREDMQDLLLDLCRRYRPTVLFVTHDVSEAARLADRVVILSRETRGVAAEERLAPDRSRQPDDPEFARVLGRLRTLLGRARGADSQY